MDNMFDRMMNVFDEPFMSGFHTPEFKVDVKDNGDSYDLTAELPGYQKGNITLTYKDINEVEASYTDPLQMKQKSNTSKYLKYRQKHTLKGSLDLTYDRYSIGTSMTWKSKTLAVDYFLVDEREKENPDVMDYVRSMLSPCMLEVGLISAPVATNNTSPNVPCRILGRIKEHRTDAAHPHPEPPAWTSCCFRS